jgi:hypothetical protein
MPGSLCFRFTWSQPHMKQTLYLQGQVTLAKDRYETESIVPVSATSSAPGSSSMVGLHLCTIPFYWKCCFRNMGQVTKHNK